MPFQWQCMQCLDFFQCFLQVVFAKAGQPALVGPANFLGRTCFGNGQQLNRVGGAACAFLSFCYSLSYVANVVCYADHRVVMRIC